MEELTELAKLWPAGIATLLPLYLVIILIKERRDVTVERTAERAQHQQELADARGSMDADRDRTLEYLRKRIVELNGEADILHARVDTLEARDLECRTELHELRTLVRLLQEQAGGGDR